jgi:hypothetical protein
MVARMPDDVPRDMPHMCREFPGRRTFIPSNPRTGGRCSLYAASERRPTSGGVPLVPRGGEPRSSPPAARAGGPGGVRVVPLNRFCGRSPGRPRRRAARPPKPGRDGTRRGNSGPLTAARGLPVRPGPGQCGGQESSRGGGLSPGLWARRPGGQGRGGLELPAVRSLRISGPEDKKFRSRSGGGCREAGPGPVPASTTGAASSGTKEQARRTRPGPDRLKSSNG